MSGRPLRLLSVPALVPALVTALATALVPASLGGTWSAAARSAGSGDQPGPAGEPRARVELGDKWNARELYTGSFPDPTVVRVDGTYYAASTTIARVNLPVLVSTDLVNWQPREPRPDWATYSPWPLYNETMVNAPTWAATSDVRDGVRLVSQWAPSLAQVGDHFVAAFSAATQRTATRQSCIGVAVSASPVGPYEPVSSRPLVCFGKSPRGAIDPDVFVDPQGTPWLTWKNEGIPNKRPPQLMVRQLDATGTAFAPGSRARVLVERDRRWEGTVVENPSMVFAAGRYYLLYSGNHWHTSRYAVGYAVCAGPTGPCRKAPRPLLRTNAGVAGPGGADAFLDAAGQLRVAYAGYDPARVGPGLPRTMRIGTLAVAPGSGALSVAAY